MSRMKSILTLLVVLGLAGGGFAAWWFWNGKKDEIRLAGVVETQEVRLGSKNGGRVEKLLVAEGDTIKKDQVLVVLPGTGNLTTDQTGTPAFGLVVTHSELAPRYKRLELPGSSSNGA